MKICFLSGLNPSQKILDALKENNEVYIVSEPLQSLSEFDVCISFGYRHILKKSVLNTARRPVVNLHISYLPFNRGAHPNFWSFAEGTPKGVTIHEIDEGVDTGALIFQKKVDLSDLSMPLKKSYQILIDEIEQLFIAKLDLILSGEYQVKIQALNEGSVHKLKDLPVWVENWDITAKEVIEKCPS